MKSTKFSSIFALLVLSLFMGSALASEKIRSYNDSDNDGSVSSVQAFNIVKEAANSLGGEQKLLNVVSQKIVSVTQRFEPEQAFEPGGEFMHVADLRRVLTIDLTTQRSVAVWNRDMFYPVAVKFNYTEIINGDQGAVLGVDAFVTPPQSPMFATRLGSRVKQYLMTSPLALLQRAYKMRAELTFLGVKKIAGGHYYVVSMPGWDQRIKLYINTKTKMLLKAETLEDDTVYGDALFEVMFKNWLVSDGLNLPNTIILLLNNKRIAVESRESINLNIPLTDEMLSFPEELKIPLDQDLFAWGVRSSQYFGRLLPVGFGLDIDQTNVNTINFDKVAPGIYHIRGFSHHSMLVELNDFLVYFDPSLYEGRSQAILQEINKRIPNKPIKYVISSHFHNDHLGGIRGFAAIGATIIVGEGIKEHIEAVFKAPHTVKPDSYSALTKNDHNRLKFEFDDNEGLPNIIEVAKDKPFTISDGTRTIRIFDIPNIHAKGLIMPYVEDAKLVFIADLYGPGGFVPLPPPLASWAFNLFDALTELNLPIEIMAGTHNGPAGTYEQFLADVAASR